MYSGWLVAVALIWNRKFDRGRVRPWARLFQKKCLSKMDEFGTAGQTPQGKGKGGAGGE